MSWHCEDASINYSQLPAVMEKWHAITARSSRGPDPRRLGDVCVHEWRLQAIGRYLTEIDVGIWEQRLNDENWAQWVQCKREIAPSR